MKYLELKTACLTALLVLTHICTAETPVLISQPDDIPGKWETSPITLPDLKTVNARQSSKTPVYGLYSWCNEYRRYHKQHRDVGWTNFRIGGPMDDETMKLIVADDVTVMMTVGGKSRDKFDTDEAFIDAYLEGLRDFLRRYGPKGTFFSDHPKLPHRPIRHVEIWNEPNFQYMLPKPADVSNNDIEAQRYALYAKLLPKAYRVVKNTWPDVQVVGFGAGGVDAGDLRFIKHTHEANPAVASSYDILSTHPYPTDAPPDAWAIRPWGKYNPANSLARIQQYMADYGAKNQPVWYTEVGWPIAQEDGGRYGSRHPVPINLQAAYTCRLYIMAVRMGVPVVQSMFICDTDNYNGGFFDRDGSYRPSAIAVRHMINLMPHPRIKAIISENDDGVYIYRIDPDVSKPDDAEIIMAWRVAGPKQISLPCRDHDVKIVDMLGHTQTVKAKKGKIAVEIGPCPIYVHQ